AIYTNNDKVLLDTQQGNNVLYLPLDQLRARSGNFNPNISNGMNNTSATPPVIDSTKTIDTNNTNSRSNSVRREGRP
ncbi:MAG: hypothetical protein IT470_07200, partial [Pseudomonadales bacterium]|nr:hypothetical protein [Pseudomonadales bacterium]